MSAYTIQKTMALLTTASALFFLTPQQFLLLFIVLGQGHFVSSYLYQYLGGKITRTYLIRYSIALLLLLLVLVYFKNILLVSAAAALLFLFHFLHDEITLAGEAQTRQRLYETAPIFLLFSAIVFESLVGTSLLHILAPAALLGIVMYSYHLLKKRFSFDLLSIFFFCGTLLLSSILWLDITVSFEKMIGSIIIFHYIGWYVHYYFKLKEAPMEQRKYIWRMIGINALVIACFFAFTFYKGAFGWLFVFFAPGFFYLWTILHILTSYRKWPS